MRVTTIIKDSPLKELEPGLHRTRRKPRLPVRVEKAPIPIVRDLATVLHLANHVIDGRPIDWTLFAVHLKDVVVDEVDARREVGLRELVRNIEAKRPELVGCSVGCSIR